MAPWPPHSEPKHLGQQASAAATIRTSDLANIHMMQVDMRTSPASQRSMQLRLPYRLLRCVGIDLDALRRHELRQVGQALRRHVGVDEIGDAVVHRPGEPGGRGQEAGGCRT